MFFTDHIFIVYLVKVTSYTYDIFYCNILYFSDESSMFLPRQEGGGGGGRLVVGWGWGVQLGY